MMLMYSRDMWDVHSVESIRAELHKKNNRVRV